MKRNLLVLIVLLVGSGVWEAYGQYIADVSYSKERFCEDEKDGAGAYHVTISIKFSDLNNGTYDFKYKVNGGTFTVEKYNSSSWSKEVSILLDNTIEISEFYFVTDDGMRTQGEIINGSTTIVIDPLPAPLIDTQVKRCRKEVTLEAAPGGEYTAIEWSHTGVGTFIEESDTKAKFEADVLGDYTITYQVTNGVCVADDNISLTITEQATPSATFELVKARICSDETGVLLVTGNADNRYNLTLNYTDGTNSYSELLTGASQSIGLPADETTTYTILSLIDREDCDATYNEQLLLTVDQTPVANAGFFDQPVCGTEVQLGASLTGGNSGSWSVIDDNDGSGLTIEDSTEPQSKARLNYAAQYVNESYTLRWTEVNGANAECTDFDDVVVEFDKEPLNVSLGNDTTLYLDKEVAFIATGLDDMPLHWTLPDGVEVDDYSVPNLLVSNLEQGDNKIICTIENGVCPAVQAEKLIRVNEIYQTTGFSPNGDGVNDLFKIGGAKNVANNKFVVFDVTGKVVYEANDFMRTNDTLDGWNGVQNNGELKDGTYYYIFTGDEIEPVKNYLIIKGSTK